MTKEMQQKANKIEPMHKLSTKDMKNTSFILIENRVSIH